MNTPNTATPAPAATPVPSPTSVATPAPTPAPGNGEGGNQEGKVTISTKEFAQLSRDAARGRSAQRRSGLNLGKGGIPSPTGDPTVDEQIREANERADTATRDALKIQVQGKVRDLLDKDQFKAIPKSTRELILKNPHLLSQADNLDEAMLDIEDFLIENALGDAAPATTTPTPTPGSQPGGHETPPAIGSGAPAPAGGTDLEDTSKLSGPAKTQAMIRNTMRKNKK